MPVNPAARYQAAPVAINAPGNCFLCKTTVGPFIVTGLRHDYWKEAPDAAHDGDVYICFGCVRDMFQTTQDYSETGLGRVEEARRAGILEGILIGKRIVDEFHNSFVDSSIAISHLPGLTDNLLAKYAAEVSGATEQGNVGTESNSEVSDEGAEQVPVALIK